MATKEEINKKVDERIELEKQMQQLQQQQAQIQQAIANTSARIIRLDGWLECAGVTDINKYLQEREREKVKKKKESK